MLHWLLPDYFHKNNNSQTVNNTWSDSKARSAEENSRIDEMERKAWDAYHEKKCICHLCDKSDTFFSKDGLLLHVKARHEEKSVSSRSQFEKFWEDCRSALKTCVLHETEHLLRKLDEENKVNIILALTKTLWILCKILSVKIVTMRSVIYGDRHNLFCYHWYSGS